ncbi:sensor histidine kinase [Photobacterium jeanii]|nr:HAMP domain-containing sensor histidine kinase [Photobacterium jeanii]
MIYQGALLAQAVDETGVLPPSTDSGMLTIYNDIDEMPAYLKTHFRWSEMKNRQMLERYVVDDEGNKRYIYAMKYPIEHLGKHVYIVLNYLDDLENEIKYDDKIQRGNLVLISFGLILILVTIIAFTSILYWRLLNPVERMFHWITHSEQVQIPAEKELKYKELNRIVERVETNREQQKEFIKREEFFLRTLSHELRTPIAIILSSVELMERVIATQKVNTNQDAKLSQGAERATARIMYAVTNMKKLVQTLLWLSRKNDASLPTETVNLSSVVHRVIEDNRYLLQDKSVDLDIVNIDDGAEIIANDNVLQLLFENLIRNAFQYSHQGQIRIVVADRLFTIVNPVDSDESEQDYESYGIGLYLVEKICDKVHYRYEMETDADTVTASLRF